MTFWLSKILWAVISPMNMAAILLVFGVGLGPFFRRVGYGFCACALAIIVVFGVLPTGSNLVVWLERQIPAPASLPDDVTGILVLGGMFETRLYNEVSGPQLNENVDRALKAMEIGRKYPQAKIVFSGGTGFLTDNARTEDMDIADFLARQGYPLDNVIFENQSRNTYENILDSKELIQPGIGERWILITSAYHMPRAMAVIEELGWGTVIIPVPVDYRTNGQYRIAPRRLDVLGELYRSTIAIKEIIGLNAYRFLGRA
ncbi:YdcF family protein [Micavibrio aeruginosavorus]|uniref:Putative membrane protein n=1 Tax=Micavibrio aeruginosavorus EPB TaxID=349215 RepID=M4VHR6_9BACT|nr:YdcF family protein [Micavibrio aeruginosavorus]AGH98010.1 Putative membrane protein [Micavibrio aeruginosavorus EPB]